MRYRRATTPGATYFFTVVTYQRQKLFYDPKNIILLRHAFRKVKANHPFDLDAIVVLPDHLHCIWTLPPGDSNFSTRWRLIKSTFSRLCPDRYKHQRNASRHDKQEQAIWQRRFWEHQIRDDQDFRKHLDYIHYNPVHHKLVQNPQDWPHSSFYKYVKQGFYEIHWASEYSVLFDQYIGWE